MALLRGIGAHAPQAFDPRLVTGFLRDEYLLSRWAWVVGIMSFAAIYIYMALLFSFAYFGIAKVSGIAYSWTDALVASLFIPLFATELPKTIPLRLLGGIQFTLAVVIGVGTFFSFLQRRLFMVRTAATVVNDKLTEDAFQEKFKILGTKLAESPTNASPQQVQAQEESTAIKKKKKKKR